MKFVGIVDPVNVRGGVEFVVLALFGIVFGDFVGELVERFVGSSGGLVWFSGK